VAGKVALRIAVSGIVVLSETANANAATVGTRVGVKLQNAEVDWDRAKPETKSVLDYTYTSAPVDWEAPSGMWEIAERWTCQEQWGFMRGSEDVAPTLWSRFATKGDYTLEAYLATPMDWTRGERSPIDLNVSVEGDGRDVSSGYSFLFGARGRSVNRVYRGDEAVWEKGFELPPVRESTHRDWFYVRLERRTTSEGLRFRYFVNNSLVADYTDADPLGDGGRIAFWTYNGGLSVARARLWHNGVGAAQPLESVQLAFSEPVKNALGAFTPRGHGSLRASAQLASVSDAGPSCRENHQPAQWRRLDNVCHTPGLRCQ
jgi:hypothetical protein